MSEFLKIGNRVIHAHTGRACTIIGILPGVNQLYRVDFGEYSIHLPAQDLIEEVAR